MDFGIKILNICLCDDCDKPCEVVNDGKGLRLVTDKIDEVLVKRGELFRILASHEGCP